MFPNGPRSCDCPANFLGLFSFSVICLFTTSLSCLHRNMEVLPLSGSKRPSSLVSISPLYANSTCKGLKSNTSETECDKMATLEIRRENWPERDLRSEMCQRALKLGIKVFLPSGTWRLQNSDYIVSLPRNSAVAWLPYNVYMAWQLAWLCSSEENSRVGCKLGLQGQMGRKV